MRLKPAAFTVLAFFCAAATSVFLVQRFETAYYPYVVIQAPGDMRLTFLRAGRPRAADCEAATSTVVNLLLSACRDCRLEKQLCLDALNHEQRTLLSGTPLDIPSVNLRDGVVTYAAPNAEYALMACKESEKQSSNTSSRVSCYAAGSPRPATSKTGFAETMGLRTSTLAGIALAALFLGLGSIVYLLTRNGVNDAISRLASWPRRAKRTLIFAVDTLSIEATLWLAFALRFETLHFPQGDALVLFALAPLLALPIFVSFGLYLSIIRYIGMQAVVSIVKAVAVYVALLAFAVYTLDMQGIPRSAIAIHGLLALLMIGASRAVARSWLLHSSVSFQEVSGRKNVVIYGAGAAGVQLATALAHSKELKPVAFLDDDIRLHRSRMGGLDIFPPDKLRELVTRFEVREVVLAIPSASRFRRNQIIDLLEPIPVLVRTLPGLSDLFEGKIKTEDLREVEIEDLLGRNPVTPDAALLKATIADKSVMVTGAGGSIGSELCRQILALQPKRLVLFEQSEFLLYNLEQELLGRSELRTPRAARILPILGSVTSQSRLEQVIEAFRVDTIFHAAAYKHVPMVEKNPCEGVYNNVFGTFRAAQAALNKGVSTFVLISTDKAVRPTNTMGTTKRFAELILQGLAGSQEKAGRQTRFSIVRFGNVLGSSGSVVPLFREQIRRGGPVTVTDPRIVRYFMTIPEATQLVIQAGAMGKDGDVLILDMGEPVKILDLAHRMIHLSGLQVKSPDEPLGDIEVVFTGLRPGEKLYEELLIGEDGVPTEHPRIMRANEKALPMETIRALLARMETLLDSGDSDAIRSLLLEAVDEFEPQCGNEDLLHSEQPKSPD